MDDLKNFYLSHFNPNPEPYILEGDYAFKIPCLTDMHLIMKEPANRRLYIPKQMSILYNLEDMLIANQMDTAFQLGDLQDKGEDSAKTVILNHLEHMLGRIFGTRNSFILRGNHEVTFSKNNLFYAHTDVKSNELKKKLLTEKLMLPTSIFFKAVDKLTIGNIEIHFMHFDKDKRYYIPPTDKFVIALFHEDLLTLESKDKLYHHKQGMGIDIENTNIMENIDVAICAHIHKPMETFRLNNLKKTQIIIPGSLCQRTREENHTKVDIPVICITKMGEVEIKSIPFKLGDIEETMNVEKDTKMVKQRQLQKEIKKYKERANLAKHREEFLESLTPEERQIIEEADHEIMPVAVAKYLSDNY